MGMDLNTNKTMRDQERITDFIASQKQISSAYDTFAGECANPQLRDTFLNILNDEHKIQFELFTEANSRGWYQTEPADVNKINQAVQKFSNPQS